MAFDAMIQVRLREKDKVAADALFLKLGLETSSAIRMFIKRAIALQSFPFDISEIIDLDQESEKIDGVPIWTNKQNQKCCYFEDYMHYKLGRQVAASTNQDGGNFKAWCSDNKLEWRI